MVTFCILENSQVKDEPTCGKSIVGLQMVPMKGTCMLREVYGKVEQRARTRENFKFLALRRKE